MFTVTNINEMSTHWHIRMSSSHTFKVRLIACLYVAATKHNRWSIQFVTKKQGFLTCSWKVQHKMCSSNVICTAVKTCLESEELRDLLCPCFLFQHISMSVEFERLNYWEEKCALLIKIPVKSPATGRIAAAHGRFSGIRHVATVCTPPRP